MRGTRVLAQCGELNEQVQAIASVAEPVLDGDPFLRVPWSCCIWEHTFEY